MANAFDEFDTHPPAVEGGKGPLKITVNGGSTDNTAGSQQGAPVAPRNQFDEFDEPVKKQPPTLGDVGTHVGIGVLKGIPEFAKFVGSLPDTFMAQRLGDTDTDDTNEIVKREAYLTQYLKDNFGEPDPSLPNGYTDEQRQQAFQAVSASGKINTAPPSNNPSFAEMTERGMRAAHLDPEEYFPTPDDPQLRIAEAAGSFGVQMLLPFGGAKKAVDLFKAADELSKAGKIAEAAKVLQRAKAAEASEKAWAASSARSKVGQAAWTGTKRFGTGAASGVISQGLTESVPDDWKPLTSLVTGFAAPVGVELAGHGFKRGLSGVGEYIAPALPWTDKELIAARTRLSKAIDGDRNQAIADLEAGSKEIIPGSKPTAAKASGRTDIGSFENAMARTDPQFKGMLQDRRDANAAKRVGAVQEIADRQAPSAAADYFHARMRELEARADALEEQHRNAADSAREDLGPDTTASEVGNRGRAALQQNFKTLNDEATRLWKTLDGNMEVATDPVTKAVDEIYGQISPEEAVGLDPVEQKIQAIVSNYGPTLEFGRFKRLRSLITTSMRNMNRAGNAEANARLTRLLNSVEDAVGQSIRERVAQEESAVAAGQMRPEDTIANRLMNDAQQFDADAAASGQGNVARSATGDGLPEAPSSDAVPRAGGTAGEAGNEPAAAPGMQGLPPRAGAGAGEGVGRPGDTRIDERNANGQGSANAAEQRPPVYPAEPRPGSSAGRPGGAGVRPVSGRTEDLSGNPRLNTGPREGDGSLAGLPRRAKGSDLYFSAWPEAQQVAEKYMQDAGLPYDPPSRYVKADPARGARIAEAYEAMKHDPQNPEVRAAYDAMAKETLAQYQAILDSGMTFDFIPKGMDDPYHGNPRNMTEDVRNNKHMWVYSTEDGFGSNENFTPEQNPLLADSGFKFGDRPATINDIFRAVHDYFGHVKEGVGFRADGEENAWRAHSAMYSPLARKAMTSETRGQNSWVNFGPHGETNRSAKSEATKYADQKTGLLPDWVVNEGAGDDNVGNVVREQFDTAGRPAEEGLANGKLIQDMYNAMAATFGVDVDALANDLPAPVIIGPNQAIPASFAGGRQLFQHGEYHPLTALIDHGPLGTEAPQAVRFGPEIREIVAEAYRRGGNRVEDVPLMIDNEADLYQRSQDMLRRLGADQDQIDEGGGTGAAMEVLARGVAPSKEQWRELTGVARENLPAGAGPQTPIAPPFYSAVLKTVMGDAGTKAKKGSAQQWMSILKNAPGVKADELDFLGVEDWLNSQGKAVTQQELADYIAAHQLQMEETVLGNNGGVNEPVNRNDFSTSSGYRELDELDDDIINERADDRVDEFLDDARNDAIDEVADDWGRDPKELRALLDEPQVEHPDMFGGTTPIVSDPELESIRQEVDTRTRELAREQAVKAVEDDHNDNGMQTMEVRVEDPDGQDHYFRAYFDRENDEGWLEDNEGNRIDDWTGPVNDIHVESLAEDYVYDEYVANRPEPEPQDANTGDPVTGRAEYEAYADSGGDYYREMLLSLPDSATVDVDYYPPHFRVAAKKNVVAHVRFDTRDVNGKRTLFLQEVQSDWHQQGQKGGYSQDRDKRLSELEQKADEAREAARGAIDAHIQKHAPKDQFGDDTSLLYGGDRFALSHRLKQEAYAARSELVQARDRVAEYARAIERGDPRLEDDTRRAVMEELRNKLPELERKYEDARLKVVAEEDDWDNVSRTRLIKQHEKAKRKFEAMQRERPAPEGFFKETWPDLVMKRMIRWAAEHGYDQIAWTPGDLKNGNIITRQRPALIITREPTTVGEPIYRVQEGSYGGSKILNEDDLAEEYGRSPAKQLIEGLQKSERGEFTLPPDGSRIGGDLQYFYGTRLPSITNKLVKKMGSEVTTTPMRLHGEDITAMAVPITDKLRQAALAGQPLFQNGERGVIVFGDGMKSLIKLLKNADASTGVHELAHHFLEMYRAMAERADAPNGLKADWRIAKDWWLSNSDAVARDAGRGVTPEHVRDVLERGSTGDDAIDAKVHRGLHEQWARAFEKYLGEGKAPTPGLKRVFDQFKDWMTRIYRSLTGLNVNLSDDMRGVFDRMLGGDTSRRQPNWVNKEQAQRYEQARAATKKVKDTFGASAVSPILKRSGKAYPFTMSDEAVAGKLWQPGPAGAGNMRQIMDAAGNSPQIKQAVTDAAVNSLKAAAMRDGRLVPERVEAWRARHADALALPEMADLNKSLATAKSAEEALVKLGEQRAELIKQVQQSAIGKLLKVSESADVVKTIGGMLGRTDAVKSMRELVNQAKKDPDAMAGLQSAVAQHIIDKMKTPKGDFRSDTFQRWLNQNRPALREVLSKEQMGVLDATAADLARDNKSVVAPGGGSNTAENLSAEKRYGLQQPTLWGKILQVMGAPIVGGALGAAGTADRGWVIQMLAGAGSAITGHVFNRMRERGIETVEDIVREALLDPALYARLLKKMEPKKQAVSLANYLASHAMRAAAQTKAEEDKRKDRKAFANGGSVKGKDIYTSPPPWARGIVDKLMAVDEPQNPGVIPMNGAF